MFVDEKKQSNLHWARILRKSEVERIDVISEPKQISKIIFDSLQPDCFEPKEDIYLLVCGWGKCKVTATIADESLFKAKPVKLLLDVPRMRMCWCSKFAVLLHVACVFCLTQMKIHNKKSFIVCFFQLESLYSVCFVCF